MTNPVRVPLRDGQPASRTVRVVAISDTHAFHERLALPSGDILVHAGDFCSSGKEAQARNFADWVHSQPHRHKVIVAGNHDVCLERHLGLGRQLFRGQDEHYLLDREVTVEGLRFYGSPWQPEFFNWAFNLPRGGDALRAAWARIPTGVDVLVTHGPPMGIRDLCPDGQRAGCADLRAAVFRARPRLHLFGHIHEGQGAEERDGVWFGNAAVCTGSYHPTNSPLIFDVEVP
jgi:3',5'-cyclic AMP phosphodiesterase CpdA